MKVNPLLSSLPALATVGLAGPAQVANARTIDEEEVVADNGDDEVVEITEVHHRHHHHRHRHWGGISFGTVLTPYKVRPGVRPSKRVTSDQARACLHPQGQRYCGNVRGFDMRFNFFHAGGSTDYPRWQGFFRTGFTTGRLDFEPRDLELGYEKGDARALAYSTVPLFLGGNLYLFKRSPVRPYGGLGFGFDVLQMQYARHDERPRVDASARIGFELHAGIEARITNWVALNAEVMQLWSARRKIPGLPDFSNEGLTFVFGVSVNFPMWGDRHAHVKRVKTVKKVRTVRTETDSGVRVEVRERDVPDPEPRSDLRQGSADAESDHVAPAHR